MHTSKLIVALSLLCLCLCYKACQYDTRSGNCSGDCSGTASCIQVKPGVCQCSGCAFDYSDNRCYGQCGSKTGCMVVGPTNTTCACTGCGWRDSKMDECYGPGCAGNQVCFQPTENGGCKCGTNRCWYDFAKQRCDGICNPGYMCRETSTAVCSCLRM
ncbi:hypothetical protein KIPB_009706 [Kipferlia bialata]|uniref:Uncharacterized protein n=1 Tax=Kipferlia bialata TaxID=797122 RepID=A0A9K3GKZ7_9EUKA|nr:hypothetical protein KIPB_009706 [Kipferlia bialata]|eukprot:g9706.t1